MKIRSLHPDFFTDGTVARLPFAARLLFAGLWCHSDDYGRGRYLPKAIEGDVFPRDAVDIVGLLGTLTGAGLIRVYSIDTEEAFYVIPTWDRYQSPKYRAKSSIPPPTIKNDKTPGHMDPGRSGPPPQTNPSMEVARSGPPPQTNPSMEVAQGEGEGEVEVEGEGEGAWGREPSPSVGSPFLDEPTSPTKPTRLDSVIAERTSVDIDSELSTSPDLGDLVSMERRDKVWDMLVVLFGEPTNDGNRGRRNRAVKLLKQSGADPDEMHRRFQRWPVYFGDATLTDIALANHWDTLGQPPVRASKAQIADIEWELDRQRLRQRLLAADEGEQPE